MRFLLFLFSFIVQIQIGITQTNIQSSVKSKYYLDTYVGYSNANYKIDKSLPDNATHINKDLAIPLGFKAEILICENFGIGVDAFFNKGKVGYIENEYEYSFERNLMQFLATANWHYSIYNSKLDFSFQAALGYKKYSQTEKSNDLNFISDSYENRIKFTGKLSLTTRYFITENIGFNASFSVGSPFLSGGLTAKF